MVSVLSSLNSALTHYNTFFVSGHFQVERAQLLLLLITRLYLSPFLTTIFLKYKKKN